MSTTFLLGKHNPEQFCHHQNIDLSTNTARKEQAARRARGGKGARGRFRTWSRCSAEQRDYTYMQNAFSVFMSNADGEGASMPEADVN